jgi:hypothetical protein
LPFYFRVEIEIRVADSILSFIPGWGTEQQQQLSQKNFQCIPGFLIKQRCIVFNARDERWREKRFVPEKTF